VYIILYHII